MSKWVFSTEGFLDGVTKYYNEAGKYIGYSQEGTFGGEYFYDASGHKVGYSTDTCFGGKKYYDEAGNDAGYSVVIIPVRGYRESGSMETVNPEVWKPTVRD